MSAHNTRCRPFTMGKLTETNLVHDCDASILASLVELHHGGRDVARGDYMLLLPDGRLDDIGMMRVGDQADDKIMLAHFGIQSFIVGHIE